MSDSTILVDILPTAKVSAGAARAGMNPNLLKQLRSASGLTQTELATLVGMKQPNISAIERGRCYVGESVKAKLAEALGCKVVDLGFQI